MIIHLSFFFPRWETKIHTPNIKEMGCSIGIFLVREPTHMRKKPAQIRRKHTWERSNTLGNPGWQPCISSVCHSFYVCGLLLNLCWLSFPWCTSSPKKEEILTGSLAIGMDFPAYLPKFQYFSVATNTVF